MSLEALAWVLDHAPYVPPSCVAVLMGLANHADDDGRAAHPSQERLARYARKSVRSVRNDLAELERRGLIRRGDQRRVAHLPPHRRPIVWDLAVERRRTPPGSTPAEAPTRSGAGSQRPARAEVCVRPVARRPEAEFPMAGSVLPKGRKPASHKPSLTVKEPDARGRASGHRRGQCRRHRGCPAHNCGPCRSEALGGDT